MLAEFVHSWWRIVAHPGSDTVISEKERADVPRLLLAVAVTCLLGALSGLHPSESGAGLLFLESAFHILVVFVVVTLALFLAARLIGGRGGWIGHSYCLSFLAMPVAILLGLLGRLDVKATLLHLVSLSGLVLLASVLLLVYALLQLLLILDGVHGFGVRKSLWSLGLAIAAAIVGNLAYQAATGGGPFLDYLGYLANLRSQILTLTVNHAEIVLFSTLIATVLGIVAGILITLPPRQFRWWHLLLLLPLALFAFLLFGSTGSLGPAIAGWFNRTGPIGRVLPRSEAIGVVGTVLLVVYYALFLAGERAANTALYTAGVLLTIPSIALFGIFIPIFGIGFFNAAVALILYAQLPILRNTYTGIRGVDPAVIESARGMGMTEWQILVRIKAPLAMPVIMAGIRISVVMIVGIAAIATLIGVSVLGKLIFDGMQRISNRLVLAGALAVSVFAILVDILLGWGEKLLTPVGLRGREGKT